MSEPSARRGAHRHRLAGLQHGLIAALESLDATAGAAHPGRADFAGRAAEQPMRAHAAMRGENGAIHALQEADGALGSAPGVVLASWSGLVAAPLRGG